MTMDESTKRELLSLVIENSFTMHEEPVNDFQRQYATRQLITEEFSLEDMRLSYYDIMRSFMAIIRDLKNEQTDHDEGGPIYPVEETLDDDGLVPVFESKVSELYSQIMRANTITFTFYFPWNLDFTEETEFEELGVEISEISKSDWEFVTERFKNEPDVDGVRDLESQITEGVFTFWKAEVEARGPDFAFSKVSNAIQVVCAKLNYSNYQYSLSHASERYDVKRQPNDLTGRWTEIQRPFGYLLKDHNGAFLCKIFDHEGRHRFDEEKIHHEWRDTYNDFPSFDSDESGTRELLQNVMLTYQSAFEADDSIDAFFKFWRGVEELTQVGRGEKSEAIDRAMFCVDFQNPKRYDPLIEDIKDELWEVRNHWVHQPNWKHIYPYHEKVCKYLLDATIEFYLMALDGVGKQVIPDVFRYATMQESDLKQTEEAFHILNSIDPE
jgi:hypothetical protein